MKLRRAATLVVAFEGARYKVHNFLTKQKFFCSQEGLDFLGALEDWQTPKQLMRAHPDVDPSSLGDQVARMVEYGALVVQGTPEAEKDKIYREGWRWGLTAGMYHFSVRETRFVTGHRARLLMRKRRMFGPSPAALDGNRGRKQVVKLKRTDLSSEPFALMSRRRSQREFDATPVPLQALTDCLFAGNGVVGKVEDPDFGKLPLTMTPSGGARNPFELYVYAAGVTGLKAGFYHYGALRHDLGLVRAGKVDVPEMLGTQRWPAKAGAIIFLVAHFPRTMWKYHNPLAYRVVMMEAGFIGQNIALTATHYGLSAIPSGALMEPVIERYLGTPPVDSAVVLSLSIGKPRKKVRR